MVDKGKVLLFFFVLMLVVFIGIEYVYGVDKCCKCCKEVATPEGLMEYCTSEDGCCRCSFFKEKFGIDIYFWKK